MNYTESAVAMIMPAYRDRNNGGRSVGRILLNFLLNLPKNSAESDIIVGDEPK